MIKSQLLYQLSYRGNQLANISDSATFISRKFAIVYAHLILYVYHMTLTINNDQKAAATSGRKLTATTKTSISKDGKWKTYHAVPYLMQYIPPGKDKGTFFARVFVKGKVKGKGVVKRASLHTTVFTVAKDRLPLKVAELRKPAEPAPELGTFAEARTAYLADIAVNHALSDQTKAYWNWRVAALLKSWPELDGMKLADITVKACRNWGEKFAAKFDETNFNNTLSAFRSILKRGGLGKDETRNPAFALSRLGVKPKELILPEPKQFEKLVLTIACAGGGQSRDCADLVEFLAYSGCRISEARLVAWQDVNFSRGELKIHSAKRSLTSSAANIRFVPIIPPMRRLLERLASQQPNAMPTDRICVLSECEKSLTNACKKLGIARLTHHSCRHFFASVCIEAGVDIPTVSRWLGHLDGGVLAMRIYGHLRRTHSQDMAAKVTFGQTLPENVVPMIAAGNE